MTFRQFVIFISIFTALMWAGWVWVLIAIDPSVAGFFGFVFFYITFFLALFGSISLVSLFHRRQQYPGAVVFYLVSLSFRQGLIIASTFTSILLLQGLGGLRWWTMLIVIIIAITVEVYFLRNKKELHAKELTKPQFNHKEI